MCCCVGTPLQGVEGPCSQGPLFVLEDTDASRQSGAEPARLAAHLALLKQQLAVCLKAHCMFHHRLLRDVRLMKRDVCAEEGELDVVILATRLAGVGYRVQLRSAIGGGVGVDCFRNLRNEFLVVAGEGEAEGGDYIVETSFRDHFAIPCPTPRYAALLAAVPTEVVAPPASLAPLVQLLCAEMSAAFEQRGLALPPWRQGKALISKWLPTKVRELDFPSPCSSPKAGDAPRSPGDLAPDDAAAAAPSGAPPVSIATSGAITPCGASDGESPRAVLHRAAVVLTSQPSAPHLGQPLKPRSLLSADLAATGAGGGAATCCSPAAAAKAVPGAAGKAEAAQGAWQEPPIRRVKMQGLSARA